MYKVWLLIAPIYRFTKHYKIEKECGFDAPNSLADLLMESNEKKFQKPDLKVEKNVQIAADLLYKIRDQVDYKEIKAEIHTTLLAVSF
jgi:hypothetical protein